MTLTCHLFRDGTIVEEAYDPSRISDTLQDDRTLLWLDVVEPSEQDLAMLQEEFDLPPVVIEDVREQEQRPHVEAFEDAYFSSSCTRSRCGSGRRSLKSSTPSSAPDTW
jgi:magnesium transporter